MSLKEYQKKRRFNETPEPEGSEVQPGSGPLKFVIQLHAATRRHYDLRIELDGVYMSWAVPKGPSLNPNDQRLAVRTEDHPLEYGRFEGVIPPGNYGAGTVLLWDRGTFVERSQGAERADSEERMRRALAEGHLTMVMSGHKIAGEFALVRLEKDPKGKAWLLLKKRDAFASYALGSGTPSDDRSVATGRTLAEIAAEAPSKGEVWLPGKGPVDAAILKADLPQAPLLKPRSKSRSAPLPPPLSVATESTAERFPRGLKPMLFLDGTLDSLTPIWLLEPRLEGYRAIAELSGKGDVQLRSRQGLSYNQAYPEIIAELKKIPEAAVLDGEIVVLDQNGLPAYELLKNFAQDHRGTPTYFVYDVLHLDGMNLRSLSLTGRKALLAKLSFSERIVRHLPAVQAGSLTEAEDQAEAKGFPGIVARHIESPYESGVSPYWVRLPLRATHGQKQTPRVSLTHLERLYFPEDGYTKGDLVAYYRQMAPYILPYLKDRPESLHRHPNGIGSESFFQKDMSGFLPSWVETVRVESASSKRSIDYLVCQNEATLLYMANLGCIELNPWLSRVGNLEAPDYSVIDLDPDGQGFDAVVAAARTVKEVLDAAGIPGFCKTSGATGMHIYIPLQTPSTFETSRALAEAICRHVEARLPEFTTMERTPTRRRGKMYLDYMQNRRGQTLAAAYCVRPRAKAPVSTPLSWDEVIPTLNPTNFTIVTVPARVRAIGDIWHALVDAVPVDAAIATERVARL